MKPASLVGAAAGALALVVFRRRLSVLQLAVGAVFAAGLALQGSGLVTLPDLEETAKEIGPALGAWAYLLVGAMAFLETAFFLGLVAPGELSVVLGGFIAGQGRIDPFVLGAIVFVCAAAGDTISFALGRRLGRGFLLRHGREFGITPGRLDQVDAFFRSHGSKTILVGRFVGLVRALAPFVAGASGMPLRRFLPIDYLAAAIWTVTFVGLGYVFWESFDTVVSAAKAGSFALGVLLAVVVVGVVLFRRLGWSGERLRRGRPTRP